MGYNRSSRRDIRKSSLYDASEDDDEEYYDYWEDEENYDDDEKYEVGNNTRAEYVSENERQYIFSNRNTLTLDIGLLCDQKIQSNNDKKKKKNIAKAKNQDGKKKNVDDEKFYFTKETVEYLSVNMKPHLFNSKTDLDIGNRNKIIKGKYLDDFDIITRRVTLETPASNFSSHCIQSLIPPVARVSVLGPIPRSSLTIKADHIDSAILLTWSTSLRIQVVPLVGLSAETAHYVEQKIWRRVREYFTNDQIVSSKWTIYWDLSNFLVQNYDEWVNILRDIQGGNNSGKEAYFKTLLQACGRAGMFVGKCHGRYEMFKEWNSKNYQNEQLLSPPTTKMVGNASISSYNTPFDQKRCLICFDEIPKSDIFSDLLPCGHNTCSDCLKAHFKSAANSGEGHIRCAAHKCNVNIGVYDAAHLLDVEDYNDTLKKILHFDVEKSVSTVKGSRFCPSPRCGNLLRPSPFSSSQKGFNILFCDGCGISLCSQCKTGGPCHPGLSCDEFQEFKKAVDSGKADNEMKNILWILENSRPCPKCQYPIERNGGCNHIRCQKCQYYFCFHCGGEGQKCMAYYCSKTNKSYTDKFDYNNYDNDEGTIGSSRKNLTKWVNMYKMYRSLTNQLNFTIQMFAAAATTNKKRELGNSFGGGIQNNNSTLLISLEIQILQVLSWNYAKILAARRNATSTANNNLPNTSRENSILQLELVLYAIFLRDRMISTNYSCRPKSHHHQGGGSGGTLYTALGLKLGQKANNWRKKKKNSMNEKKKNKKIIESIETTMTTTTFQQLFINQELESLCKMDEIEFLNKVKESIRNSMRLNFPNNTSNNNKNSYYGRRRRQKGRRDDFSEICELNKRLPRVNVSWRNKNRNGGYNENDVGGEQEGSLSTGRGKRHENNKNQYSRWKKGKKKASMQRCIALDRCEI